MKKFLLFLLIPGNLFADSYIEKTMAFSATPAKTWTSGAKQRTEMTLPFPGIPTSITIFRADLGVQWTINNNDQTYFETSMASPHSNSSPNLTPPTPSPCQLIQLKKTKKIGELTATGFQQQCPNGQPSNSIYWFSPPTGIAARAQMESEKFSEALSNAQYASYPSNKRAEAATISQMTRNALVQQMEPKNRDRFRKSLLLAVEVETNGQRSMSFQVTKISQDPLDPALFEIPAGYQKSDPFSALLRRTGGLKPQPVTK